MNFQDIRTRLKIHNLVVFTTSDFMNLFGLTGSTAAVKLTRYKNKGYIESPKRGVYILGDEGVDKFRVANVLYSPSYVSMEAVLSNKGIIPEVVYAITSVTTKATREFSDQDTLYKYYKVKTKAYTGYFKEKEHLIATPEKALVDYLYYVSLGKRKLNERINFSGLEGDKIHYYVEFFSSNRLNNLVRRLIE